MAADRLSTIVNLQNLQIEVHVTSTAMLLCSPHKISLKLDNQLLSMAKHGFQYGSYQPT